MNQSEISIIKNFLSSIKKDKNSYAFLEPVDYKGLNLIDYPVIIKKPMDLSTISEKLEDNKYDNIEEVYEDIQLIWDNCKKYNLEGSTVYKNAQACEKFTKRFFDKHNPQTKNNSNSKNNKKTKSNIKEDKNNNSSKQISEYKSEKEEINDNKSVSNNVIDLNENENKINENLNDELEKYDKNDDTIGGLTGYEKVTLSNRVRKLQNDGLASLVRLVQKECAASIKENDDNIEIILAALDRKTYEQINRLIDTFLKVKESNQENIELKKNKTG